MYGTDASTVDGVDVVVNICMDRTGYVVYCENNSEIKAPSRLTHTGKLQPETEEIVGVNHSNLYQINF